MKAGDSGYWPHGDRTRTFRDDAPTLQRLAKEADAVQNASNLSGVLLSFSRVVCELRELGLPWATVDHSAIVMLWADKIASLTGTQGPQSFGRTMSAFKRCREIAAGESLDLIVE